MIKHIEFCDMHNELVKSTKKILEFTPGYNCITGEIWSGKTVLLKAIQSCKDCAVVSQQKGKIYYFFTEHHDIRYFVFSKSLASYVPVLAPGTLKKVEVFGRCSHGEGNSQLFRSGLKALALKKGDTFLVDEPEAGLDLYAAIDVADSFNDLSKEGIQIIVTTHHPVFVSRAITGDDNQVFVLGGDGDLGLELQCYISEWEEAIEVLREDFDTEGTKNASYINVDTPSAARSRGGLVDHRP